MTAHLNRGLLGNLFFISRHWSFWISLAGLIPPPRKPRSRYLGVLVPNALLCQAVTACAGLLITGKAATTDSGRAAEKDPPEAEPKAPPYGQC